MGAALTLAFVILAYLSPADMFPGIGAFRIQLWFAVPAAGFALLSLIGTSHKIKVPQVYLFIGMIFAVGFSRLANRFIGASAVGVFDFLVSSMILYLVLFNFNSTHSLRMLAFAMAAIGVYFTIQGAIALVVTPGESYAVMSEALYSPDHHVEFVRRIRAGGFLSDPNDLAQFLLVAMALLGFFWGKNGFLRLLLVIFPGAIMFAGVALTRSRGGLLGVAALLGLTLMDRVGKIKSFILTGLAAAGMIALNFSGNRAISMEGGQDRLDIWRDAWGLFQASPLWGVGYGWFTHPMFGDIRQDRTAHNSFILCMTELGLIGLFFWLALIVYSYAQLNAVIKLEMKTDVHRDMRRLARALRVALSTFLVTSWFLSRTYTMTFYLLIGAVGALVAIVRQQTDAPSLRTSPKWLLATVAAVVGCLALIVLTLKFRNFML